MRFKNQAFMLLLSVNKTIKNITKVHWNYETYYKLMELKVFKEKKVLDYLSFYR